MLRWYLVIVVALAFVGSQLSRIPTRASASPEVATKPLQVANAAPENSPKQELLDQGVELTRDANGHFYADVRVNGTYLHMLVDTGASSIALSREDARKAGLATSIGMPNVVGEGADGEVHGEYAKLDRVELGPLSAEGLDAIVLNSGDQSLLGQSFLSKFKKVEIDGDRMLLQ